MSRRDRRAARSHREEFVPEKKPVFVYVVVFSIIALMLLALLSLLVTSPTGTPIS